LYPHQNNIMNIKESNKHFKKLASFYENISGAEINAIELDLLKSYVLKFYESITDGHSESSNGQSTRSAPKAIVQERPAEVGSTPTSPTPVQKMEAAPVVEHVPAAVKMATRTPITSEMKSLFMMEKGKEISDQLSTTGINDIGKSMSINEKIFTIQELFNGNQGDFDDVVNHLNGLKNYDDAMDYLASNVVNQKNWLDQAKVKEAKTFMKLVYRKYI